jgi:tripartite-type tricarboxylate transporter receptor subunit TctC
MKLLQRAFAGACVSLAAFAVAAADFPVKPIRLVVVYQPGGANDIVARVVGNKMAETLGQPVIVENRAGANGMIGARYVASSAPDGYTLLVGGASVTVSPAMFKAPLVDAKKDFVAVGQMVDLPIMLAAAKDLQVDTPAELVALARAEPGKLTMAITAPSYMFYTERMNTMAGISLLRVPYRGVADAMNDVPAGRVNLLIDSVAAQLPHIKAGRTKAIAVFTADRQPNLPDVPTLNETAFKGFVDSPFIGLLAPAGTPPAVVARLNAEMRRALQQNEVKTKLEEMGFVVATSTPEAFAERIRTDIERYEDIGRKANIPKE